MSAAALQSLLPLLLLVLGAAALLLAAACAPRRSPLWLDCGTALALAAALVAGGVPPQLTEVGGLLATGPAARYGTLLFTLLAALTLLLSRRYGRERGFAGGEYAALVLFAAAGMALTAAATTLVGFFLGLESLTLALYILIAFDKSCADGAEAGLKYLVPGATATGLLAFGIALLYVAAGSFAYADLAAPLSGSGPLHHIALAGLGLVVAALAFKLSLPPFHLWTPDVYQGAPAPVSGLLSAGSKGAVAAGLVAALGGTGIPGGIGGLVTTLTILALAVGALAPIAQRNLKRLLAYSSTAQMGFVAAALVAGGAAGSNAALFYLPVYALASIAAFGVLAALAVDGQEPQHEEALRGLGYRRPWHAAALTVALLSLAGVPASAGFIAKFGVLLALLDSGHPVLAVVAVAAALVAAYVYLRLVVLMYMAGEGDTALGLGDAASGAVLLVCAGLLLFLGLWPGPLLALLGALAG